MYTSAYMSTSNKSILRAIPAAELIDFYKWLEIVAVIDGGDRSSVRAYDCHFRREGVRGLKAVVLSHDVVEVELHEAQHGGY